MIPPGPFHVYIATNRTYVTLYTGSTKRLKARAQEHRRGGTAFTRRYRVSLIVYVEGYRTSLDAFRREREIKLLSRSKKVALIERQNPTWRDLLG